MQIESMTNSIPDWSRPGLTMTAIGAVYLQNTKNMDGSVLTGVNSVMERWQEY